MSYPCERRGEDHETPDCTFDWAFPIDWILDVQKVLEGTDLYKPLGGHIVWRYGPDDGLSGRPVGLCEGAQAVIDAYVAKKEASR